ncbi:hypothetical protein QBC46DRAFT_170053 [Diplogelasinospora grovesii]|uniref:Secreted protein n=1 Tax=Diplogelasinospora grovesii TaxID=303347 RepID=A0AAN6N3W6_9PEZI|nr:hypothetical protein QBC46DRAFT_170053 [Diplogelasinospora grovesii]
MIQVRYLLLFPCFPPFSVLARSCSLIVPFQVPPMAGNISPSCLTHHGPSLQLLLRSVSTLPSLIPRHGSSITRKGVDRESLASVRKTTSCWNPPRPLAAAGFPPLNAPELIPIGPPLFPARPRHPRPPRPEPPSVNHN